MRVTTEVEDVVANPLESENLIHQALITRVLSTTTVQETKVTQTVVDAHDDDIALKSQNTVEDDENQYSEKQRSE